MPSGYFPPGADRPADQGHDILGRFLQGYQLAGPNPAEIEKVLDDLRQILRFFIGGLEKFALLLRAEDMFVLLQQQLDKSHDGRQGGTQLVGRGGNEIILHPVDLAFVGDVAQQGNGSRQTPRRRSHRHRSGLQDPKLSFFSGLHLPFERSLLLSLLAGGDDLLPESFFRREMVDVLEGAGGKRTRQME